MTAIAVCKTFMNNYIHEPVVVRTPYLLGLDKIH